MSFSIFMSLLEYLTVVSCFASFFVSNKINPGQQELKVNIKIIITIVSFIILKFSNSIM